MGVRAMRENLVTVREAASYLRISARTVYRLIESGQIGAVRIGKQWRIPAQDLPGQDQVAALTATQTTTQATA
ncbi:MAG: helix-turn-helix domain-containing protein [bacterium]|nr:helix-turn-helix domain-containing protein [bacterium]